MAADSDQNGNFSPLRRASAFGVHLLTVSGAAFALLAMLAAIDRRWTLMFVWLGCALIVDSVDGALARGLRVRTVLPRWSGDVLDLVVDALTYVFVPAYAITTSGLIPHTAAVVAGLLIVCTGSLYFADTRMKTSDNYFLGFPAVWNLVAFYLFVLRPDPWLAFASTVILCVATFLPVPFLHPLRVVRGRVVNIILLLAWTILAVVTLAAHLAPAPWITGALCAIAVYFILAGAWRAAMEPEP